jgi:hypothetical protein
VYSLTDGDISILRTVIEIFSGATVVEPKGTVIMKTHTLLILQQKTLYSTVGGGENNVN